MERSSQVLTYGDQIENYSIERLLGAGGFGMTYKGFDRNLGCAVAIKEYFPSMYSIRDYDSKNIRPKSESYIRSYQFGLQRFLDEARVLAKFKNNNIVRVSRFLESNNTAYIIMDYEEGMSLQHFLDSARKLSEKELCQIAIPVMRALTTVHKSQYLHRDLKPANIYLRKSGSPVLLDFGSARQSLADTSLPMTRVVSEGYAPFEQYNKHDKQGVWTDLYGLGATLYHCISGKKPIDALDRLASRKSNVSDPLIPAIHIGKGFYATEILEAIDRMLSLNMDDRPSSVEQILPVFTKRLDSASSTMSTTEEVASILPEISDYQWDAKQLAAIESQLTHYMGPLSAVLIKKSLPQSQNMDELLAILCNAIDEPEYRQKFYSDIEQHTSISVASAIKNRLSSERSKTDFCQQLSHEFITTAEQRLSYHIGPVASVLVRNALDDVSNLSELLEVLACEIPTQDDRLTFINDLEIQHSIMTSGF